MGKDGGLFAEIRIEQIIPILSSPFERREIKWDPWDPLSHDTDPPTLPQLDPKNPFKTASHRPEEPLYQNQGNKSGADVGSFLFKEKTLNVRHLTTISPTILKMGLFSVSITKLNSWC